MTKKPSNPLKFFNDKADERVKKMQAGGGTSDKFQDFDEVKPISKSEKRIQSYTDKGWSNANAKAVKTGYAQPKDTVNTQYLSKDKYMVGIKKKMGGSTKSKK